MSIIVRNAILALGKLRQKDCCEFNSRLSSELQTEFRSAWAISKNKQPKPLENLNVSKCIKDGRIESYIWSKWILRIGIISATSCKPPEVTCEIVHCSLDPEILQNHAD